MEAYMYKYNCPGQWWGTYDGLRNVYSESELTDNEANKLAKEDIKKTTGYKNCGVTLLVKYKLSIESIKAYPDITKIPFSEPVRLPKKIGLD
jgi:hypothetical protein|tara:strand:+ start:925 stop:1200 length:276 start_codon:yes stop_codon:yes gene_type:complete